MAHPHNGTLWAIKSHDELKIFNNPKFSDIKWKRKFQNDKRHTISLYKKIIIYACILALKNSNVKISTEWQDTNMILKSFLYVNDLFAKNIWLLQKCSDNMETA